MSRSLILYPINSESAPNYVIRKSFAKHFRPFWEYDWVAHRDKIGLKKTHEYFIKILQEKKPEYVFMQIQHPGSMDVCTIKEMAKYTKIINWSGDLRNTEEWYNWLISIGKEIYLTLFSNETDPQILQKEGCKADYLQVGFDNIWYNKQSKIKDSPEIVFCCNDYGDFPLSDYRVEVTKELIKYFGKRFKIYGSGWEKHGITTNRINNLEESLTYNSCKIAISVSNFAYERYYSDRLLRIMGCGAFPLSHDFVGLEKDFAENKNIVVFRNLNELISKAEYYLEHDRERKEIANNAYNTAHLKCTWDVRCKELIKLLDKYDK